MAQIDYTPPPVGSSGPGWAQTLISILNSIKSFVNGLATGANLEPEAIAESKLDAETAPTAGDIMTFTTRMRWAAKVLLAQIDIDGTPADADLLTYDAGGSRMKWSAEIAPAKLPGIPIEKIPAIPESKLDVANDPTDDYLLYYDADAGKPAWGGGDGFLPFGFIALNNAPTDSYVLKWNAAAGKPEWAITASSADSGALRWDEVDPMEYLSDKMKRLKAETWTI